MFCTIEREAGSVIDTFPTKKEAEEALSEYETSDKADGCYEPRFYAIRATLPLSDSEKNEIRDAIAIIKSVTDEYSEVSEPFDVIDYLEAGINDMNSRLV